MVVKEFTLDGMEEDPVIEYFYGFEEVARLRAELEGLGMRVRGYNPRFYGVDGYSDITQEDIARLGINARSFTECRLEANLQDTEQNGRRKGCSVELDVINDTCPLDKIVLTLNEDDLGTKVLVRTLRGHIRIDNGATTSEFEKIEDIIKKVARKSVIEL
jgi:hypothetical protein